MTEEKPYILRINRDELEEYVKAYLYLEKEYGDKLSEVLDSISYEEVDNILFEYEGV